MTEYVAQAAAEAIAYLGDALMGGKGGRVRVAAVLDQRDFGVGRAQNVVVRFVDRPIKAVGWSFGCHGGGRTRGIAVLRLSARFRVRARPGSGLFMR